MTFSCSTCNTAYPIEDEGMVLLQARSDEDRTEVEKLFQHLRFVSDGHSSIFRLPYRSRNELLEHMPRIGTVLNEQVRSKILFSIYRPFRSIGENEAFIPFDQFMARLERHDLVTIIQQARFMSYLQPIIDNRNEGIYGYEFLLRPQPMAAPFSPYELFETAIATGLHSFLDRQARLSAIETSRHKLPHGIKRFINFLPSSIYNPNYCLSHTFSAIEVAGLQPDDFVFEVVETERIEDIGHLQSIFSVYKKNGVKVALDDVGSGFSSIEVLEALQPDYVKIDRGLITFCDTDSAKQNELKRIMDSAKAAGALVLAEGIERPEEWAYCRSIGIDLAQGYLFGKPAPDPLDHSNARSA